MRVLVTRALTPRIEAILRDEFAAEFRTLDAPMTVAEARDALAAYDALLPTLGDALRAEAFTGPIRTKLLANFGVGVNHIDVAAAKAAGLAVTNTPGAVTDATADIAMTLLLISARRASEGERMLRAGGWTGWAPTQMLGAHVTGKRLGVIGMGRIGQAVARRAAAFGMEIHYHNRRQLRPETEADLKATYWDSLDQMVARMDVISVNCPHTPSTFHLLNARRLKLMKPSVVIVNTSRGEVIDENALVRALKAGEVAGAGLDVYEHRANINPALRELPNVVALPHMGSATREGRIEMGEKVLLNIKTFADGHRPPDLVVPGLL